MREYLQEENVWIGASAASRDGVLGSLVDLLDGCGCLRNAATFYEQLLGREEESTTAVGGAVAIPHAHGISVRRTGIAAITLRDGVNWGAPDGMPVRLAFLVAAEGEGEDHLALLSRIVTVLMRRHAANALIRAESAEAFLAILTEEARRPWRAPHCVLIERDDL